MNEEHSPQQLSPKAAWAYAAQWGVCITGRELGACMYGFDERCKVQSEQHRADCMTWIEDCVEQVNANPSNFDDDELKWLGCLATYIKNAPLTETDATAGLDQFTLFYIQTMLWAENDPDSMCGDESLSDSGYTAEHLHPETLKRCIADCAKFQSLYGDLITVDNYPMESCIPPTHHAAHDFWMTRVGSGVGFWDGDWKEPAATILSEACRSEDFGHLDLYPGDDGRLYF